MKADLLITRHPSLVELLREKGVEVEEVKTHATPDDVRDKVVVGILPLHLAALTKMIITPVLALRPEDRGKELSLEELKERFKGLQAYKVLPVDYKEA